MATERLRNVFDRSLDLLDTILAEIAGYSYPPDALEAYVQRHANSVACLGHDAATLIDHAGLAGVPLLIRVEYFYYSQHTHAELGGLIGRHFYGDLPALNLRTMTFFILLATAATPQLLKTHTPQMHVNDSTRFLEELLAAWIEHDHPPSHS